MKTKIIDGQIYANVKDLKEAIKEHAETIKKSNCISKKENMDMYSMAHDHIIRRQKMRFSGDVEGLIQDVKNQTAEPRKLAVEYTADRIGKTLSIGDTATGIMYTIPFDALYKIITGR